MKLIKVIIWFKGDKIKVEHDEYEAEEKGSIYVVHTPESSTKTKRIKKNTVNNLNISYDYSGGLAVGWYLPEQVEETKELAIIGMKELISKKIKQVENELDRLIIFENLLPDENN